tara:strand:- start:3 stop:257 length:255 start_codon:yes stop_codon:yes gene_type:complete
MKGKIKIGQNKWLDVEWIVGDWWQITESHRCTEASVGDMVRTDLLKRGLSVYTSLDTPTPKHVFPSAVKLIRLGTGVYKGDEAE